MSEKTFKDYVNTDLLSTVEDEAERNQIVRITDALGDGIDDFIRDRVKEGVHDELTDRGFAGQQMRAHDKKYVNMLAAWKNNGHIPNAPGIRVEVGDMIAGDQQRLIDAASGKLKRDDYIVSDGAFHWDNPMLIPRVIASLVREPAEIVQVLTPLLTRVRFEGPGQTFAFPAVSSYHAGNLDMPEGGRYPEGMIEFGATVVATIGKSGIKVRFTEEMLKYSMFDVMALHLRAAGQALARWKEDKIAKHIMAQGSTRFDNSVPTLRTQGRDADLLLNGTFSLQDLHDMYSTQLNNGFIPNALIINPMAWSIFAQDPTMRNWAYAQGGANRIWQRIKGEVAAIQQWRDGMNGTTQPTNPELIQNTWTDIPDLFPYPLRLIVTPHITYNGTNNTTSILMVDTNELGILAINEEPTTDEFKDPERDVHSVKIRERYAINVLNEGKGVIQAKNVFIARSYDLDDKVTLQHTGPLPTGTSYTL